MKLSILIVNWNSREYLRRCLTSLDATCREIVPQIVVVDAGSFDGCGEMLVREFPDVQFVQSPENIGFGRSNNLGFTRVTGDALLLLNPDTEILPGAVQSLLEGLRRFPEAGIVGPWLMNADGSFQSESLDGLPTPIRCAFGSRFLRKVLRGLGLWREAGVVNREGLCEVEAVAGACMLLWSRTFRDVGGFSREYFMYAEDMDLCLKVRRAGRKIYQAAAAKIVHHGGGSSRTQVRQFSTVMIRRAEETYMRLNHGLAAAFWYRVLQAVSACVRLALLLPACVVLNDAGRAAARESLKKWWYVLQWAAGTLPIRPPAADASLGEPVVSAAAARTGVAQGVGLSPLNSTHYSPPSSNNERSHSTI